MTPAAGNQTPDYYLPHHCVIRADSTTTKLRVVFNASAKTTSGHSLNDLMERGPNLQQDLQDLILKWRQYAYAYTADVEKMFRMVWLNKEDQKYQKVIWRDSPSARLQEFQLTTVTYGMKAAPFLAMMTLRQLADDEKLKHQGSAAPEVVASSFYMHDLVHGSHSVNEAKQLLLDITRLMKSGGFNLRKWKSNVPELLEIVSSDQEKGNYDFKLAESPKTLGLSWNTQQDIFNFNTNIEWSTKPPTKQTLLSAISKLFDPLGWLSPVTPKFKILFQQVWRSNIKWDDPLPENILQDWLKMKADVTDIHLYKIPRWLGTRDGDTLVPRVVLHGFSDASTKAYSCVVYCRIKREEGASTIMIEGKTRLVPLSKSVTLPKLELSGELLLSKLMNKIQRCLQAYHIEAYGWVDSMVVLGWLNGELKRWKLFVANRVKQINQVIPATNWRYIKSEEKPADCASRGLSASLLKNHKLWWSGPTWLTNHEAQERNKIKFETDLELRKPKKVTAVALQQEESIPEELLMNHSSLSRATRILAWVYRFILTSSKKINHENKPYLTLNELNQAKIKFIKQVQCKEFNRELTDLKQKTHKVSGKSKLNMLNPFMDENEVLRVGGRLKHAHISSDMKHPIIIPNNSRLSELIIDQCHELTYHGGARLTLSFMRQKYWLIGGLRATKKRVSRCVRCRRQNPSQHHQIMGDLPPSRVIPSRPFLHTGVDYTGHFYIKTNKGRGANTTKGYIAVFVCMVTKALNLSLT